MMQATRNNAVLDPLPSICCETVLMEVYAVQHSRLSAERERENESERERERERKRERLEKGRERERARNLRCITATIRVKARVAIIWKHFELQRQQVLLCPATVSAMSNY